MSILLWITTGMEYKIKCYNRFLLLLRVVINLTIKGLRHLFDKCLASHTERCTDLESRYFENELNSLK